MLTDPTAIQNVNKYLTDLFALVDLQGEFPLLRPQIERFRFDFFRNTETLDTKNQLSGFLQGLMVAGILTVEQGRTMHERLEISFRLGWT